MNPQQSPKLFSYTEVKDALSFKECSKAIASALGALRSGDSDNPLRFPVPLREGSTIMGFMPAFDASSNLVGAKVLNIFKGTDTVAPAHTGLVVAFNADNGQPLGYFDAHALTEIRTAAASALATDVLSRKDGSILTILGTGPQAFYHALAITEVRPIERVVIWGRKEEKASALQERLNAALGDAIAVEAAVDKTTACKQADIICTVTSAINPILFENEISPGTHINAVGACTPRHIEICPNLLGAAEVFTDSLQSLTNESAAYSRAVEIGNLCASKVVELGALLNEEEAYTRSDSAITLYKSLGLGVMDLAAAGVVLDSYK